MVDKVRIDKWLWAARFFKTRALANEAVSKNQIRINGQRIKPSRTIVQGDTVAIEKHPFEYTVTVLGLNDQRRPAREAQLLYEETEQSIQARQNLRESLRTEALVRAGLAGDGRPTKKQRRQIIRFQNLNEASGQAANRTAGRTAGTDSGDT